MSLKENQLNNLLEELDSLIGQESYTENNWQTISLDGVYDLIELKRIVEICELLQRQGDKNA